MLAAYGHSRQSRAKDKKKGNGNGHWSRVLQDWCQYHEILEVEAVNSRVLQDKAFSLGAGGWYSGI